MKARVLVHASTMSVTLDLSDRWTRMVFIGALSNSPHKELWEIADTLSMQLRLLDKGFETRIARPWPTDRPVVSLPGGAVCKGSILLGSACLRCQRCLEEWERGPPPGNSH